MSLPAEDTKNDMKEEDGGEGSVTNDENQNMDEHPTYLCENGHECPDRKAGNVVPDEELRRCAGCKIVWYCSKKCQRSHWKREHKAICKPLPMEQVEWVKLIREHIALVKNTEDMRLDMMKDAVKEYYKNFDPDLDDIKQAGRRGTMCVNLTNQKHAPPELTDAKGKKNNKKIKESGIRALSFYYNYLPATDDNLKIHAEQYKNVVELMQKYDPNKEFVLLVICSNEESGQQCQCCEIIRAKSSQ